MQEDSRNAVGAVAVRGVSVLRTYFWARIYAYGVLVWEHEDMPDPKSLNGILGDRNARVTEWGSWRKIMDGVRMEGGGSVSLTCNQDNVTVERAQDLAAVKAVVGAQKMATLMPAAMTEIFGIEGP